jgi:hypothetical protein
LTASKNSFSLAVFLSQPPAKKHFRWRWLKTAGSENPFSLAAVLNQLPAKMDFRNKKKHACSCQPPAKIPMQPPIDSLISNFKSTSRFAAHFQIQTRNTKSSSAQIKHHLHNQT